MSNPSRAEQKAVNFSAARSYSAAASCNIASKIGSIAFSFFVLSRTHETNLLAPFEIWEVLIDNRTIKFKKPLVLTPQRMPRDPDEPGEVEYWEVIYPELAIDVFAETRDELIEAAYSNLRMNWKHYAQKEDDRLSVGAKTIKNALLAVAEVIDG